MSAFPPHKEERTLETILSIPGVAECISNRHGTGVHYQNVPVDSLLAGLYFDIANADAVIQVTILAVNLDIGLGERQARAGMNGANIPIRTPVLSQILETFPKRVTTVGLLIKALRNETGSIRRIRAEMYDFGLPRRCLANQFNAPVASSPAMTIYRHAHHNDRLRAEARQSLFHTETSAQSQNDDDNEENYVGMNL